MEDESLGFWKFIDFLVTEIELDIEVGEDLVGVIDEGCSIADQLVGAPVVVESDASGDDIEGTVQISGMGCGVEGAGGKGGFDDQKDVNKGREDSVSSEERISGCGGSDSVGAYQTAVCGHALKMLSVAWRLGFIQAAGKNANSRLIDVEGSEVGGDIDSKRSSGDDGAPSEGEVLGKFLGDGFTLGCCTTGADDTDFGVV